MFCMTISATRAQAIQQTMNDNLQETRTDRLLDQSSYNPTSHNTTTTLTRQAQLDCDSPDSLQDKTDYLSKNDYNTDFVRRNTHSNTDTNTQTNVNSGSVYDSNYTDYKTVTGQLAIWLMHLSM